MAYTSDKKPGALNQVSSLGDNNNLVVEQSGDVRRATIAQLEAKIFDAKNSESSPAGTEVVVVRKTDDTLRQVALSNIVPALNITNARISESAAIADTKLATIATAGKVLNTATTATPNNTINAIVARDGSGDFSAGIITATLAGNITGNAATATAATALATGRTISLTGDVTATTGAFNGSADVSAAASIASNAVTTAKIADGNVTLDKLVAAVQQALVPAGAVQAFAMNSTPSGWLACNGDPVSRTDYAALFSAIGTTYGAGDGTTTFNLPDLRGYFVRGSGTNGDAVASGTFGAKQADALKTHTHAVSGNTGIESANHVHSGTTSTNGNHNHPYRLMAVGRAAGSPGQETIEGGVPSAFGSFTRWNREPATEFAGNHNHSITTGGVSSNHTHAFSVTSANPSTGTSTETRPHNIAMLYCIKF